ncbi:hypothetical protein LV779_28425 [Streptomyces thinghirensis]|nr:hypothetical protein [Streptomyces thinghirensis]
MTNDSTADDTFAEFLNFGAGVLSLVLLSCSVIWGLVAQDRIVLDTRQRILAQAVHRTTRGRRGRVPAGAHRGQAGPGPHHLGGAVVPFGLLATDDESLAAGAS